MLALGPAVLNSASREDQLESDAPDEQRDQGCVSEFGCEIALGDGW
jgi:hypothetical protein